MCIYGRLGSGTFVDLWMHEALSSEPTGGKIGVQPENNASSVAGSLGAASK